MCFIIETVITGSPVCVSDMCVEEKGYHLKENRKQAKMYLFKSDSFKRGIHLQNFQMQDFFELK